MVNPRKDKSVTSEFRVSSDWYDKSTEALHGFCHHWNLSNYITVAFSIATGMQVLTNLLQWVFYDVKFSIPLY